MVGAVDTIPENHASFCDTYGIGRRFNSIELGAGLG
jgi:hypothetical protein